MADKEYKTFGEFYPYYLNEHRKLGTRVTHFIGTSLFFILTIIAIIKGNAQFLLAGVISAYFFAWLGHFFI